MLGERTRVLHRQFYIIVPIIELVMFVHCVFIFALQNIALGGYLDTRTNIEDLRHDVRPEIHIYREDTGH